MSNTETRSGSGFGFGLFTLFLLAVFVSLGVWQLQRRVEKHALIAALDARLAAAPVPLPPPAQWKSLTRGADEFRRVTFTATYEQRPDAMVFSSGSAVRADISGPGAWAFLPARLPDGDVVVVNAGFVQNTMQDRAQQDRAVGRLVTGQPVTMTGYLRFPEVAGMLTPKPSTASRILSCSILPSEAAAAWTCSRISGLAFRISPSSSIPPTTRPYSRIVPCAPAPAAIS